MPVLGTEYYVKKATAPLNAEIESLRAQLASAQAEKAEYGLVTEQLKFEIISLETMLDKSEAEKAELVKQLHEQIRECQRLNKLLELEDNQEVNK